MDNKKLEHVTLFLKRAVSGYFLQHKFIAESAVRAAGKISVLAM